MNRSIGLVICVVALSSASVLHAQMPLPPARAHLVEQQYIDLSPLTPLARLLDLAPAATATERVEASRPVAVRVIDLADTPLTIRQLALEQAARLFERIGVTIVWEDSNRLTAVLSRPFVVDVTILDHRNGPGATGSVLGSATPLPAPTIAAFYGDVQELAHTYAVRPETLLGFVIAHELGHLLLGPHAHTSHGLMRPVWTRTDVAYGVAQGQFRFSDLEGDCIRRRLQES